MSQRWPGTWKVACQVCGMWYSSSQIQKRWDGLLVCNDDFETRHPQTLIKVRGETATPAFVSKDPTDVFIHSCDVYSILPRADFGTADCMQVGLTMEPDPYHFGRTSIAAWAIAGIAIAGLS